MLKIAIIGGDSFIATQFYNVLSNNYHICSFSRVQSNKINEVVVEDFFHLSKSDLNGVDIVINFAAIVHNPKNATAHLYETVNSKLPIYLAGLARDAGVSQFIQISTIAVYGDKSNITENTEELPQNVYGRTKLYADKHLLQMNNNGFRVAIVRPPMVYGLPDCPGNMKRLISYAQKGLPFPFLGIKNKRSFIHVFNLVDSLLCVIEHNLDGIVLPSDKQDVSINEIACFIRDNTNQKVRAFEPPLVFIYLFKMLFPNLYKKLYGNLRVICNIPDIIYTPKYTVKEGINTMIND